METYRTEFVQARVTPNEKLALYKLASKTGGLSGALRHLIAQYTDNRTDSTKVKSADTYQGDGALQTN